MKKIEVTGISSKYEDLRVLEDISLYADERELVSILGPSGCGKSTLFNIISGLIKPDAGKVLINGEDHTGKPGRVSYMHQKDLLFPWRTIMDNVIIPLVIRGEAIEKARAQADKYFSVFGLEGFQDRYPSQLSGGMRQRAALLRTYMFKSDIMLLDEPFGGLDAITRRKMQEWLLQVLEKLGSTILFITHDIDEAIFLSDRIYLFTERPASVRRVFTVDIDRPRGSKTFTSNRFNRLKESILELL
ncbi:MAG: ABC transporter ATP-binding protein [Clostridiales bacterium]|jgi:ABC-type nitrate/sulfonate/bicarbonate transport system ATPase subunit|nr:ABC transporter ATP-binding protein [Clostridiales bacterium]